MAPPSFHSPLKCEERSELRTEKKSTEEPTGTNRQFQSAVSSETSPSRAELKTRSDSPQLSILDNCCQFVECEVIDIIEIDIQSPTKPPSNVYRLSRYIQIQQCHAQM